MWLSVISMNYMMFNGFGISGDWLSLETPNTHRISSLLPNYTCAWCVCVEKGGGCMCILVTLLNLLMTHCLPLDSHPSLPPSKPHPFHNPPNIALYNNSPCE